MVPRFRRRASPPVAHVGDGFVATEAPALATSIVGALDPAERHTGRAVAALTLRAGSPGQVVVSWRNRHVGFVPADRRPPLLAQLAEHTELAADGVVYRVGDVWRVWVGPEPDVLPDPGPGYDEIAPPVPSIFGVPAPGLVRPGGSGAGRLSRRPPGAR